MKNSRNFLFAVSIAANIGLAGFAAVQFIHVNTVKEQCAEDELSFVGSLQTLKKVLIASSLKRSALPQETCPEATDNRCKIPNKNNYYITSDLQFEFDSSQRLKDLIWTGIPIDSY